MIIEIKLPPTLAALKEKVFRAHYISQWKSAHISSPSLVHISSPDPNDPGRLFNEKDQVFEPVMTSLVPAPEPLFI